MVDHEKYRKLTEEARVAVYHHNGQQIGTLPATFRPETCRSKSPWYDPRYYDFVPFNGGWRVCRTVGQGDLEAVHGFRWL